MSNIGISAVELFVALLHRTPTEWEANYWSQELEGAGLETVFNRLSSSDEHKRFSRDQELMFVPAGHFYSPIVDKDFVETRESTVFSLEKEIHDIDVNETSQLEFVKKISDISSILPFGTKPKEGLRYHYDNNAFVYGDAIVYATMLFAHKPKRILEIGSGFSSALALDVCDMIEGYIPEVRFIDPFPQLVRELTRKKSVANVSIEEKFIQDVAHKNLTYLEDGDFYFMDTTHIVKTGSDVLYHFEEVLPRLKSGVIIHLHDIFYPFEYPKPWVMQNKLSWNEIYYFRAFLANNPNYEIIFWNDFMHKKHTELMAGASSIFAQNSGASIWFRKK